MSVEQSLPPGAAFHFYSSDLYRKLSSVICYNGPMAKPKKSSSRPTAPIINRRARFDYELGDEIIAGLVLTGPETRSARDGHVQLKGAYVTIRSGELWLNNASFGLKVTERGVSNHRSIDTSPRKLLVSKKQLELFKAHKKEGMTIVPTKLLTNNKYIKLVIALGKGKKRWDKRETIKRRDLDREHKKSVRLHI